MEEEREHSSMLARTHFNEMEIRWKIWLINKEEGIIGGIYYYEDEEAYNKSAAKLKQKGLLPPLIKNILRKVFDVIEDLSKINNAPINFLVFNT